VKNSLTLKKVREFFLKTAGDYTRYGVINTKQTQDIVFVPILITLMQFYYVYGRNRMRCPFCGFMESKVLDSRSAEEGSSIRRRRECLSCAKRFTTYEVLEELPLMVVKKDGRREMFDKNKLLNGLIRACEKRPIPVSRLETLADQVEKEIRNTMEREVMTRQIGETTMQYLKEIDQVAYVRFASVYRQFADINNFMQELDALMKAQKEK
jgi:transcriptional repressor NrdR